MNYLDVTAKHQQRQQQPETKTTNSTKKAENNQNNHSTLKQGPSSTTTTTEMQVDTPSIVDNGVAQFQHHRIRELHGDHQPLYVAPPPPNFFPPFNPHHPPDASSSTFIPEKSLAGLKAPLLVRSVSAVELPTSSRNLAPPGLLQPKKSLVPASASVRLQQQQQPQLQPPPPLLLSAAPVLATSSSTSSSTATTTTNGLGISTSPGIVSVIPAATTPTKGKRGRKPKDPVAHAAKKEAKEKRRLEKEAAMANAVQQQQQPPQQQQPQQLVFVAEEVVPVVSKEVPTSRPSTSGGMSGLESTPPPPSSFAENFETKKRTADIAFSTDMTTSWMGSEGMSIDVDSTWTMSTPLTSPIPSPETGGLGIFLQAPPSTPIDEILSSSAHLGINPALLLQEDYFPSAKLTRPIRVLKSPLEILDKYPLQAPPQSPPLATTTSSSSHRQSSPSDESGSNSTTNRKLGLMDLMLLRQTDSEDKPSPKKKPRPDLVFSTTKRGKAIVSLQKTTTISTIPPEPTPTTQDQLPQPPTTPLRDDNDNDLRSLVLKRRQQVWGDEVGTEVTRITVHRRLTARKTSTGLMSPLSPKSSLKRSIGDPSARTLIDDNDSDSSESSDSEDDDSENPSTTALQVTPLATPTNLCLISTSSSSQAMQKSFSAPGFFHPVHHPTENIFLPSTPHPPTEDEEYLLPAHHHPLLSTTAATGDDTESGMRCKTCGMLFRKLSILASHERTCMVKQTPFIPYDFLKADVHGGGDDGFVFSAGGASGSGTGGTGIGTGMGRTLFSEEDVVLTPRNLAVQMMGFEMSPVEGGGERSGGKFFGNGFVAPRDTVSSEEEEEGEGGGRDVVMVKEKKRQVVGEPKGTTRCICNKPEKAVAGVMVQW